MAELVTDRTDPRLGWGVDTDETPQHGAYLVLSEEERARGFIRPLRTAYVHVGPAGPEYDLRDLSDDENVTYGGMKYVKYEEYPEDHPSMSLGRYWTQAQLDAVGNGCQVETVMSLALAETYAREPRFYGATYCISCQKHLPVADFVWDGMAQDRVGS